MKKRKLTKKEKDIIKQKMILLSFAQAVNKKEKEKIRKDAKRAGYILS